MSSRVCFGIVAAVSTGSLAVAQTAELSAEYTSASFYWADYDGDGLEDAFVVAPAGEARLLRNRGDGSFEDVTQGAGLSGLVYPRFAVWADIDRDHDPDLFVGASASSARLFQNQGGDFADVTESSGLFHASEATHAGFIDFDEDGLLDLHLRTARESLLFRNLGSSVFTPVELELPCASVSSASGAGTSPSKHGAEEESAEEHDDSSEDRDGKIVRAPDEPLDYEPTRRPLASGQPTGGSTGVSPFPACAEALDDQSGPNCIYASSVPTLGQLFPISSELFVAPDGKVGLGTTSPTGRLTIDPVGSDDLINAGNFEVRSNSSVAVTSLDPNVPALTIGGVTTSIHCNTGSTNATTAVFKNPAGGAVLECESAAKPQLFVGGSDRTFVNRKTSITSAEYFGVTAPVTSGYGGMYVNTNGANAWPFYGYATGGNAEAWTYFDGATQKWHLNNGSFNRLTVQSDGKVGIGTQTPTSTLHVSGTTTLGGPTTVGANSDLTVTDGQLYVANDANNVPSLFVEGAAGSYMQVVWIDRVSTHGVANDLVQCLIGSGSAATSQFVEFERGADVEFRVDGDGEVFTDVGVTTPADFAEMIRVSTGAATVEPGDVLVIDPSSPRSVVKSTSAESSLVCGVYSTKPGVVGSEREWDVPAPAGSLEAAAGERIPLKRDDMARLYGEVPVAVVGIVPTKVSAENGPIRPGDLLVTSSTPGHAMRADDPRTGTVVGKALGSLGAGTGVIKILVTLQ